jgi:hypothetical protein
VVGGDPVVPADDSGLEVRVADWVSRLDRLKDATAADAAIVGKVILDEVQQVTLPPALRALVDQKADEVREVFRTRGHASHSKRVRR